MMEYIFYFIENIYPVLGMYANQMVKRLDFCAETNKTAMAKTDVLTLENIG